VGERGHGVRTPDRVDLVEAERPRDGEGRLRRPRRHDGDPLHAGHARGHRGHHERREQRRAAAGNADADRGERHPAALGEHARHGLHGDVRRSLRSRELRNRACERLDGAQRGRVEWCAGEVLARHPQ
jgi:hypothetical protein